MEDTTEVSGRWFFETGKCRPNHLEFGFVPIPFFPFTHSPAPPKPNVELLHGCFPLSPMLPPAFQRGSARSCSEAFGSPSPPTTLPSSVFHLDMSLYNSVRSYPYPLSARLPSMIVSLTSHHGCLDPCIARMFCVWFPLLRPSRYLSSPD